MQVNLDIKAIYQHIDVQSWAIPCIPCVGRPTVQSQKANIALPVKALSPCLESLLRQLNLAEPLSTRQVRQIL